MSDQSAPESDNASTGEPGASWSANGTEHEDAIAAAPESEVTDVDAAVEPAADAADAPADAPTDGATDTAPGPDDPATFLGELVRAMQTTAGAERARIAADTDRRREEHLAAIQARRESDVEKMRELAAEDLKAIDNWADDERQRIQLEHDRRAGALDEDLQKSLADHNAKIDREIEGVEAAIATYRVDVDAFFATMDRETDPVAIAQHASRRPVFPALDKVAEADAEPVASAGDAPSADAAEDAAAEPAVVAVMDPDPGARLAASFASWNAASSTAPTDLSGDASPDAGASPDMSPASDSGESADAADAAEPRVPVAVTRGAHENGPGTILHAVPSGRPLSWLRRDRDSSDRPNEDR